MVRQTIIEFLSSLRRLDVHIWVADNHLHINAPDGVLTPELQLELRERKAEILTFLNSAETIKTVDTIQSVAPEGNPPLSFAQQQLWFLDRLNPGNHAYNMPAVVRLSGKLNRDALEKSISGVVSRHEILRTSFSIDSDEQPFQCIAPALHVPLRFVDLRKQPAAEVTRQITSETQTCFNLSQGPLIRALLIQSGETEHILVLTLHHIVSDAWAMGVLVNELGALYQAFVAGQPSPLPDLAIQYADFAMWQRQQLQNGILEKQSEYWQRQLAGLEEIASLPADHPRRNRKAVYGARMSFTYPAILTEKLKTMSQESGSTLFSILLTAFNVLLARYCGLEDISVGTLSANRNRAQIESLIGVFINTIVLRTRLHSNPTFQDLLKQVYETTAQAHANQDLPFDRLVESLRAGHGQQKTLFHTMLILQNTPLPKMQLHELNIELLRLERSEASPNSDLDLYFEETEDGLLGIAEYNSDLFERATIERTIRHFQTLLEGIATNPKQRLMDLPLLTEVEQQQLIAWNATETEYPYAEHKYLHQLFEAQVEKTPQAAAVIFEDQLLTYADLNARANQLAHYLRSQKVGPEVLVGICLERSLEMVVGLLGILKAGGAYVPLDPDYPPERLAYMFSDSGASMLLSQHHLLTSLPEHNAQVLCLDRDWQSLIAPQPDSNPGIDVSLHHLAYMIYTSGSTGRPKGALNTHRGICNRLLWMQTEYQLNETDRVLQKTPFSFDVSVWEFFWPLLTGAQLVVARPEGHKDSAYLVDLIIQKQITTLHFVPSMLRLFLDEPRLEECLSIKRLLCSGEALPYELQEKFFARLNTELHNLYGPTEAAVDVTAWACIKDDERRLVPIGRPIANLQMHILDTSLRPVPVGISSELYIGGIGVGRGYHNRPELTAEKFLPDPFTKEPGMRMYRTGDLARWLPDGSIDYLGRTDHQCKIRGFRIEFGEIEAALVALPEVREVVVLAREDVPGDKRLAAYLVMNAEHNLLEPIELRRKLARSLPDYMIPVYFMQLERLPLTPNGKVDRKALPVPDMLRSEVSYAAPCTSTEAKLAEIWAEVLKLDKIGIHDNFFELGGNSLLATQAVSRLRRSYQKDVPVGKLLEMQTIAEWAECFDQFQDQPVSPSIASLIDDELEETRL